MLVDLATINERIEESWAKTCWFWAIKTGETDGPSVLAVNSGGGKQQDL